MNKKQDIRISEYQKQLKIQEARIEELEKRTETAEERVRAFEGGLEAEEETVYQKLKAFKWKCGKCNRTATYLGRSMSRGMCLQVCDEHFSWLARLNRQEGQEVPIPHVIDFGIIPPPDRKEWRGIFTKGMRLAFREVYDIIMDAHRHNIADMWKYISDGKKELFANSSNHERVIQAIPIIERYNQHLKYNRRPQYQDTREDEEPDYEEIESAIF